MVAAALMVLCVDAQSPGPPTGTGPLSALFDRRVSASRDRARRRWNLWQVSSYECESGASASLNQMKTKKKERVIGPETIRPAVAHSRSPHGISLGLEESCRRSLASF